MKNSSSNDSNRNLIITRFVLIYIASVFCILIPLYYLFDIPDKNISELKATNMSLAGKKKNIERLISIYDSLDNALAENNLRKGHFARKMFDITYDSIQKDDPYLPLYLKIASLYQQIDKVMENESNVKFLYSRLKADSLTLTRDLEKCKKALSKYE